MSALCLCPVGAERRHAATHLELDRLSSEAFANKRGLVDHALPALVLVFAGLDNLEHLLLGDAPDLGQGYSVLGCTVLPPVLDRTR